MEHQTIRTVQRTLREWDIIDTAIVRHGFVVYNRDYFIEVLYSNAVKMEHLVSFLFEGCVEAHYENVVLTTTYPCFMDDRFIDYQQWLAAGSPEGFVWGVNQADAYPGWKYIENSDRAYAWSQKLHIPMHEVEIETNTYRLTLIFHELRVKQDTHSPHITI